MPSSDLVRRHDPEALRLYLLGTHYRNPLEFGDERIVDHSGSMSNEMDYQGEKLNRLETLKKVLADFIIGGKGGLAGRGGDLLGLITFARYPDTICPLVLSHNVLLEFLKNTDIVKLRNEDGTAIGDALALSAARLQKAEEEIQQRNKKLRLKPNSLPAEQD